MQEIITLPEQYTRSKLERVFSKLQANLDAIDLEAFEASYSDNACPIIKISGGNTLLLGKYAAVISPDLSLYTSYNFKLRVPIVEVTFSGLRSGADYRVQTSPSLLVKDGNVIDTPSKVNTNHTIKVTKKINVSDLSIDYTLGFIPQTKRFSIGFLQETTEESVLTNTFEIPTSATQIYGNGEVIYSSGHRFKIDDSRPFDLPRIAPNGEYTNAEGPVFAKFIGESAAKTRIGYLWTATPPLEF